MPKMNSQSGVVLRLKLLKFLSFQDSNFGSDPRCQNACGWMERTEKDWPVTNVGNWLHVCGLTCSSMLRYAMLP